MATSEYRIPVEQLRRVQDPGVFDFKSTAEIKPLDEIIGQDRAIRAVAFGIGIESPGYHMFALGTPGTGKIKMIRKFLDRRAGGQPAPDDWCYVNNFETPDQPIALCLPSGEGCTFRDRVDRAVEELETEVPQSFESEAYSREQERIEEELQKRQQEMLNELRQKAEARSFTLVTTPQGVLLAPMINGEVANPEAFSQLDEETRKQYEQNQSELQEEFRESMRSVQGLQQQTRDRLHELDQQVVGVIVSQKIENLKKQYAEQENVLHFLDEVQKDILKNVQQFKRARQMEQAQQQNPLLAMQRQAAPNFDQYRVNVIVDNSKAEGAPVVLERNPTYHNLVGRTEQQVQFGALVTNFRMIKGGALHRANGGYLIVEARDLLTKPLAWEALKRALRNKEIKIESMYEAYGALATRSLEPEPIPLDIKVVIVGDPMLYYMLYRMDEEFRELFKVKADFADQMEREDGVVQQYARFIAMVVQEENLRNFDPSGVARVVEESARMVSHQNKLAARFGDIVDLLRQASYWAGEDGHELVQASDVKRAIDEKIYRNNELEEKLNEMIEENTILIDTTSEVVGQVNGISVLQMGDHAFGKPSRITARTYVGSAGVVNIEREIQLGGRLHNKGMMILTGYLGGKYAEKQPLAFSASVTFEQLYEEVEGDSASSAELYALLSSLSGYPIRQELAVTGSVNQRGQIQAIGGVNEKIEGFFDVCRLDGLTGSQGVIIPHSNIKHLMLREDVVQAVRDGQFHIYAVKTIDQGIELLTGKPAGEADDEGNYPEGSVNRAVHNRLRQLAERVRTFTKSDGLHQDGRSQPEPQPAS